MLSRCWIVLSEPRYKAAYNLNTFFLSWKQHTVGKAIETSQQEFELKLPRDIMLKMSRNKSFHVRARFGAIYNAFKTKKYLSKNSTTGNRLLFSELANTEFTCPENSKWWLLLPDSNLFLKFQNNFTAAFWTTFSLIQTSAPTIFLRFLWCIYYINKSQFQKFQ